MLILGISAFYHDSAAALVRDGEIIAAAQEERFTRKKHDANFPVNAITYCLSQAHATGADVDQIAFYEKPFLKFERLIETYLAFAPAGFSSFRKSMPLWLGEKLFQRDHLLRELKTIDAELAKKEKLRFGEHHFSHAASAYYPSPFDSALVLTMDGVGEWPSTSVAIGRGDDLEIVKEIRFPHSLGLLYSAFTYYTGFKVNSGEYKVMGLAPYGRPTYVRDILDNLIDVKKDGSFKLNLDFFSFCTGLTMVNERFEALFGGAVRQPDQPLEQRHMDLASSIQAVTEDVILRMTRSLANETGLKNLCLAGGVALNCVANGKVLRDGRFDGIYIQPAAGDAGGALGAALAAFYDDKRGKTAKSIRDRRDAMSGSFLGPSYSQDEIQTRLKSVGAVFRVVEDNELIEETAAALVRGQAVGWHQGRMEFGPRALGNRSILADPRSPSMQKVLNLKVKYRESFRPFAPSILKECVSDWFETETESPYMLIVSDVKSSHRREMTSAEETLFGIDKLNVVRSDIPAVTHVDYSARIQTVDKATNPRYHALISRFGTLTGCPILVNTSFNVRGEPIVATPEDAFRCFMGTELDFMAIGNCILFKESQNRDLILNYESAFELD
ncbi:MAG TPA: carbamoyltransferase [Methylovirgula sp.]|nr:carbamoyltransferase [Methylovirgula sp.]